MKKLLLSMGTVAATAVPIISVVACGSSDKEASSNNTKASSNTNNIKISTKAPTNYKFPKLGKFVNGGVDIIKDPKDTTKTKEVKLKPNTEKRIKEIKGIASKFLKDTKVTDVEIKSGVTQQQIIDEIGKTWPKDISTANTYREYVYKLNNPTNAVYMLWFAAISAEGAIDPAAAMAIVQPKNGQSQAEILASIIFGGSMSMEESAREIAKKFAGKDKRFDSAFVQLAAKVNESTKELKREASFWSAAATLMGGDNVIKAILGTIGYKLV